MQFCINKTVNQNELFISVYYELFINDIYNLVNIYIPNCYCMNVSECIFKGTFTLRF